MSKGVGGGARSLEPGSRSARMSAPTSESSTVVSRKTLDRLDEIVRVRVRVCVCVCVCVLERKTGR